ncbi:1171_t:CDS:2, partial [Funneliformis geosporum]
MIVHWKNNPNLLKQICLIDVETKLLSPDIQVGFNDSQYDWRFIVEKAKKLGVNDRNFHSKHLKIPGCVAIDICLYFMKLYAKAEKSNLAFYLNECELKSKLDMLLTACS